MYNCQSSPNQLSEDSQLQSENEEMPASHDEQHTALKSEEEKKEKNHRQKHKKRKRSRSHKGGNSKGGGGNSGKEDTLDVETGAGEQNDANKGNDLKSTMHDHDGVPTEKGEESGKDDIGDEGRKSVSWKSEIEMSQEFQASVLEQNVVVNLEVPDEKYEEKQSKESYSWDAMSSGMNISIAEKKPYIAHRMVAKQSTDGAMGSRGFNSGRHTFRFKFNEQPWGSHCSIGVCSADVELQQKGYCHLFGNDKSSWALDIPSGSLHHNGKVTQHYISAIEEKIIYMTLDFNKGCLYFQPRDRDRFLAFKGISGEKELFPCVSMVYGSAEVKIGLKHSTDSSLKILKQEREAKVKDNSKNQQILGEEKIEVNRVDASLKAETDQSGEFAWSDANSSKCADNKDTATNEKPAQIEAEVALGVTCGTINSLSENTFEDTVPQVKQRDSEEALYEEQLGFESSKKGEMLSPLERNVSEDRVSSLTSRGQPDGERQEEPEREKLCQKMSSISWAESSEWQDNDLTQSSDFTNNNAVHKTERLEKRRSSPIPPQAVYIPPDKKAIPKDIQEPEDAKYTSIESLEDFEQYGIQMSHGWDVTHRGGTVHLYPSLPFLCVPMPNFSDRVQAVRGRQGFRDGIHKWKITEIKTFCPNVAVDEMHLTTNKLHIGVASEDHRTYNYGYNLTGVGPFAWTYEVDTQLIWHGQSKVVDLTLNAGNGTTTEDPPYVDATKGIEVEINFYKHQLTLRCQGKVIAQVKQIRAKQLYPFVLFNKKALFPVEIRYLEGPEDYVEESLTKLEKMDTFDKKEDLVNYRGLTRQMSSKTNIVVVQNEFLNTYDWGRVSCDLKVKGGNTIQLSKGSFQLRKHFVALAEKPIFGQRHKIDFTSKHIGSCIFGLAGEHFDKSSLEKEGGIDNTEATVSVLGKNIHSWGWDPKTCSLYHAGRYLGRYPSGAIDFQYEEYDRLQLVVDFSSTGYNIASFTATSSVSHSSVELGIAFVNLPSSIYPCVAIVTGGGNDIVQVTLDYVSGPKGFVTDIVQAKTCTIL